jgi:hypothetical protein
MRVINFIPKMPANWDGQTAPWREDPAYCWAHLALKDGKIDWENSVPGEDRPYFGNMKRSIRSAIAELVTTCGRELVIARRASEEHQHTLTDLGEIDPLCINDTLHEVAIINGYGPDRFSIMVYQGMPVYKTGTPPLVTPNAGSDTTAPVATAMRTLNSVERAKSWAREWEAKQTVLIDQLETAIERNDAQEIKAATGYLKAVTERQFPKLPEMFEEAAQC